jgi:isoleucyl-tRNA synthetase
VRQPLARLQVAIPASVDRTAFAQLLGLLQNEVNVKRIEVVGSDADLVRLKPKPNFRSLGKRFGKQTPTVAAAAQQLTADQLRELEGGGTATLEVEGSPITYLSEDVVVEREVTTEWLVQSDGPFVAALDPHLDDELIAEGHARELVHHIQRLRREAGFDFTDRISLAISGAQPVLQAAKRHDEFLKTETLARRLELQRAPDGQAHRSQVEIGGHQVEISVVRYEAGA